MKIRASRSLKATPEGIKKANQAVLKFATKIDLAADAEVSRATVQNFFAGKPVSRENFHKICQHLQLPWQEIADLPEGYAQIELKKTKEVDDLDSISTSLRHAIQSSIQHKCGGIRVLDMSQPRELQEIYTNVNILEKINSRRWLAVEQLQAAKGYNRLGLESISKQRISGLKAVSCYSKLIVLGKPGAGKTTFLKHLAIQCAFGYLHAEKIPIFITLKDFAENHHDYSLLTYIHQDFAYYGITNALTIHQLLLAGKVLILLDGLDEVRQKDVRHIVQQVHQFSTDYYQNQFVITCRLASREYALEQFTEVEIADFDQQQISNFVYKWFQSVDPNKSSQFMLKLQQSPLQDLATNPLLLTLLCLVFAEAGDFPVDRIELYQEALNILLKKWDAKRHIERDQAYQLLSLQRKQDLLSYAAWKTFERGEYFFKQQQVEQYIAEYLHTLTDDQLLEAENYDTEALLKTIEAQHGLLIERARGVYSFSHLTFQEYFTAKYVVSAAEPKALMPTLTQLVEHVSDQRWREVFLLSAGMLPQADYLLLLSKKHIDALLAHDSQLQQFLECIHRKSQTVTDSHSSETLRAFYFDLELARAYGGLGGNLELARAFDRNFTRQLSGDLAFDLALDRLLTIDYILHNTLKPCLIYHRVLDRAIARATVVSSKLEPVLQQMKYRAFQSAQCDEKIFRTWWNVRGQTELKQLQTAVISERNFGYHWCFSRQQTNLLQQYYDANVLLIHCLNSHVQIAPSCAQKIKNTVLLPVTELRQVAVS